MKEFFTTKVKLSQAILLGCILFSCTYNDIEPNKNVYVVGFTYSLGGQSAAYWKNGLLKQLSSGSTATDIEVSGAHVYILGNNTTNVVYWQDTTANLLPVEPYTVSEAVAIAVSGSDVYLAGYQENLITEANHILYWKNGVKTILANSNYYASLTGIAVSGSDVHTSGYLIDANWNVTPAYWKNGVQTLLADPGSYTTNITLSGADVYVTGVTSKHISYYFTGCYWKNGQLITLETPDGWSSSANALVVFGADVYIAGTIQNYVNNTNNYAVVYWKNGVMTQLSDVSRIANGTSIAVAGNDVYVAGSVSSGSNLQATVWKNGVATTLGLGQAAAIEVK
ncbi:MAG TPA: hypothetical protein VL728_07185 [Cyclobacteriaceae bacterium]|nr:hypothetical protein [Cyclobacteriaceae bacterium]